MTATNLETLLASYEHARDWTRNRLDTIAASARKLQIDADDLETMRLGNAISDAAAELRGYLLGEVG